MIGFLHYLREPRTVGLDLDSTEYELAHREIMLEKQLLRRAFVDFYRIFESAVGPIESGKTLVELGSGAGFIQDIIPAVTTSDVRRLEWVDLYVDALNMPFENASVEGILAINVFHHLQEPGLFWKEVDRVLVEGGRCVLIEPANTFLSGFIHSRIHLNEYFDLSESLSHSNVTGPMTGANQARIHIALREFGAVPFCLEVSSKDWSPNFLTFLLSGGLNFRQMVPKFAVPAVRIVEKLMSPLLPLLAIHEVIVLSKNCARGSNPLLA